MAVTDTDLIALASLSETDGRRVRDMPRGIGPVALLRLADLRLARQEGSARLWPILGAVDQACIQKSGPLAT